MSLDRTGLSRNLGQSTMTTKIDRIKRGLKAAVKAFNDRDKDVVGVYQVAGQVLVCPICAAIEKKKEAFGFGGDESTGWSVTKAAWTLTCTGCSYVQMFANEPEMEKTAVSVSGRKNRS